MSVEDSKDNFITIASINSQTDWDVDVKEGNGGFFLNSGEDFARIQVDTHPEQGVRLRPDLDSFQVDLLTNNVDPDMNPTSAKSLKLHAACSSTGSSATIIAPAQRYSHLHSDRHLACVDVTTVPFTFPASTPVASRASAQSSSPSGSASASLSSSSSASASSSASLPGRTFAALGVSCSAFDGEVRIWDASASTSSSPFSSSSSSSSSDAISTSSSSSLSSSSSSGGRLIQTLQGHVGGVHVCKFFPSGKLVLTGGADGTLRVWTIAEAKCAAVFSGHAGGVLTAATVGRGRHIASGARDGCVKIWDCGTQQAVHSFELTEPMLPHRSINEICMQKKGDLNNVTLSEIPLLFAAAECGQVFGVDARSNSLSLQTSLRPMAANTVISLNENLLVAGFHDGVHALWDIRQLNEPVCMWRRSPSAVRKLHLLNCNNDTDGVFKFVSGSQDGATTEWHFSLATAGSSTPVLVNEFSGPDCESVFGLASFDDCTTNTQILFSVGEDRLIRKYIY